jgi:hypothetical protein
VEATSVTLTSETGADIYYTTDGTPAVSGDLPSDGARLYTGAIPITAKTDLRWVAFDRAGNFTADLGTYAPTVTPVPAPGQLTAPVPTAGQESATLKWESTDPSITGYGVQAYKSTAQGDVPDGALKETTAKTLTVTGLTAGATYTFTVKAQNSAGYGPESAKSTPVKPTAVTDRLTITSAKWKAGDFRVVGTGTVPNAVVTVHRVNADGSLGAAIANATANVAAPVAPSTVGAFDVRVRTGAPTANPGRVFVKSSNGGVAGPFAVANG